MLPDWSALRAEFPALAEWTFLNAATIGQLPRRTVDAMARHFARRDELACTDLFEWFGHADRLRGSIARLIHCEAADIAFMPNASAALSLLLGGIDWRPGDRFVTVENDFPNQYYYGQTLAARGVEFAAVPFAELEAALRPPTRVVALSEVSYSTGYRAPVGEIGRIARENGVLFYLDGTQSLGALACDLRHVLPDVYAVDGYKWLLAPNGAAFAYISESLRKILPPAVIGWRSHRDWRNHANLHHGVPAFKDEAERYEGGMLPFSLLYALEASVELFLELGPDAVERRVLELASAVRGVAADLGGRVESSPDSPIVTIRFPNQNAETLAHRLADDRVLVAARRGNLRVSPHIYNDEGDIERLRSSLVTCLSP